MKTPTRYKIHWGLEGYDLVPDAGGDIVKFTDYTALQEENARLRKDYGALGMMALQRLNYDLDVEFREAVDEAVEVHLAQTQDAAKGGVK